MDKILLGNWWCPLTARQLFNWSVDVGESTQGIPRDKRGRRKVLSAVSYLRASPTLKYKRTTHGGDISLFETKRAMPNLTI